MDAWGAIFGCVQVGEDLMLDALLMYVIFHLFHKVCGKAEATFASFTVLARYFFGLREGFFSGFLSGAGADGLASVFVGSGLGRLA